MVCGAVAPTNIIWEYDTAALKNGFIYLFSCVPL